MEFLQLGIGRWLHVVAGVMWIGLLYYFNFVQVPALAAAAKDGTGAGITKHVPPPSKVNQPDGGAPASRTVGGSGSGTNPG